MYIPKELVASQSNWVVNIHAAKEVHLFNQLTPGSQRQTKDSDIFIMPPYRNQDTI